MDAYYKDRYHRLRTYEMNDSEKAEAIIRRKKLHSLRRMQDIKDGEIYEAEHIHGYCPFCYMLLPMGPFDACPNCDHTVDEIIAQIKSRL